jgi:Domain of unknown function (DUF5658)
MLSIRKRDPELNSAPSVPEGVVADGSVISQLVGRRAYAPGVYVDRRTTPERRQTVWRAVLVGGFRPRRRGGRRATDHLEPVVDWHGPGLLFSAVLALMLCALDAFMTLTLLGHGAVEANPVMAAALVDGRLFAISKMALTGLGLVALVAVARFRLFRVLRAGNIVHVVLLGYAVLIAYEVALLSRLT